MFDDGFKLISINSLLNKPSDYLKSIAVYSVSLEVIQVRGLVVFNLKGLELIAEFTNKFWEMQADCVPLVVKNDLGSSQAIDDDRSAICRLMGQLLNSGLIDLIHCE